MKLEIFIKWVTKINHIQQIHLLGTAASLGQPPIEGYLCFGGERQFCELLIQKEFMISQM